MAPPLWLAGPLSITREAGELYYLLTVSQRPRTIVEFGASHRISTIYLAACLRDGGCGSLITTEILPGKAQLARHNLRQAGLEDLVEICVGDAADLNKDDPDLLAYQQHVRRPGSGFFSCELPFDAGVELSVRLESQATQHSE